MLLGDEGEVVEDRAEVVVDVGRRDEGDVRRDRQRQRIAEHRAMRLQLRCVRLGDRDGDADRGHARTLSPGHEADAVIDVRECLPRVLPESAE